VKVDPFIEAEKAAGHSVKRACVLLEVSRSAFYDRRNGAPSARELSDAELSEAIIDIHSESNGTYGAPRIHAELRHRGVHCARKRVARLMCRHHLAGRAKKRFRITTIADPTAAHRPDLVNRDFAVGGPIDARYVGDITYIPTNQGWAYLATVIDLASRRVAGWALEDRADTNLIASALTMALVHRRPDGDVVFHSDRGCQYTSADYATFANRHRIRLSVGRTGVCWDNAVAESFFATIKRELIDHHRWATRQQLRAAVFDWIEGWYNTRRLHSSLGYLSPADYENITTTLSA
jgi:putative transposase